ncbi:MAG: FtsW/RodA/SpoVE family cell cycle protein [Bacteroidetes bacterium]|jgi:cell division protein FtsW|nr:FtsW/RodA/SpoVE family cell cycle protein [Bacteroidota bacterium]
MFETIRKYFRGDKIIWMVILLLSLISLLAVYSSTGTLAYRYQQGDTTYYILKHGFYLFLGLTIVFIIHQIPYKYFSRISQLFIYLAVPLLLVTLLMGTSVNEASRWLTLPGIGLTFQTSDFAKLALMMYLARILSQKQHQIKEYSSAFLPIIIPVVLICLLILPADFSTAILLFGTSMILMFVGRVSVKYLVALNGIAAVLLGVFIVVALSTNREGRIGTWKNRIESYVSGESEENYQAEQSKIAIATGGVIGKGPGKSTQRNFLPHPYSDFIYAIILEEYGLLGGLFVMLLYLYLLFRAGMIVRKSNRTFPAFLAMGLTMLLVFQAMTNMAVAVNLLPVTGQTLPLVSMGGTSVMFTCIALGMILSTSWGINEQENTDNE